MFNSNTTNSFSNKEQEKERDEFVKNNYILVKILDKNGKKHLKKGTLIDLFKMYKQPFLKPSFNLIKLKVTQN